MLLRNKVIIREKTNLTTIHSVVNEEKDDDYLSQNVKAKKGIGQQTVRTISANEYCAINVAA